MNYIYIANYDNGYKNGNSLYIMVLKGIALFDCQNGYSSN